jgi:hypothetical protein
MDKWVVGVDPGPTTGVVALRPDSEPLIIQVNAAAVVFVVESLIRRATGLPYKEPVLLAIEKFVIGRASMRAGRHGEVTRDLISDLLTVAVHGALLGPVQSVQRSASEVKPWATDLRLSAAGLIEPTKGMNHARDAARHAIFAAVHAGLMVDPLSRSAGGR